MTDNKNKISLIGAVSIIVSNMIGMGVFTSLGFQVAGIKSIPALLALWVVGGIIAICGAFAYAELGLRFPRSGGEYNFLSRIYHPAVGFLSGWVSSTVAFAAPIAMSCMAFGNYFYDIFPVYEPIVIAIVTLALVTGINLISLSVGTSFQKIFTFLNITLILVFIVYGLINSNSNHYEFKLTEETLSPIFSSSFAVSLVFTSFAYSGWNSVTYVIDDIDNPQKTLPKALFIATAIVLVLYVALNFVFLYSTPIYDLENKVDVGAVAANNIFGTDGGRVMSAMICIALFASVNSMLIAGPRVIKVIGEDFSFFKKIAASTENGTPIIGTLIMSFIALVLILTSQYEMVMTYIGFTLSIFTLLTVIGLFVLRSNSKNNLEPAYKTWGFPITAIIFIALESWMVIFLLMDKPTESISGLVTILSGLGVYLLVKKKKEKNVNSSNEV